MSAGLACVCWPGVCACGQAVLHTRIGVAACLLAWDARVSWCASLRAGGPCGQGVDAAFLLGALPCTGGAVAFSGALAQELSSRDARKWGPSREQAAMSRQGRGTRQAGLVPQQPPPLPPSRPPLAPQLL